jgi:DNA polymerase elongation subunit (family B)
MSEEEMWEQMVQELRERRTNRKKGIMTTAVRPTGSANVSAGVVSLDFASLYPNTMRMKISMKSILRKRSINKIYA